GDRLAQRISGYARDRRSLELPRDSLGARNRRLPSRLRGVTGQTARGLAATIAPPHRRQSSLDGFRGEGGERVRVLPLQGDAAVLAGEGIREPRAPLAGNVRVLVAPREREPAARAR